MFLNELGECLEGDRGILIRARHELRRSASSADRHGLIAPPDETPLYRNRVFTCEIGIKKTIKTAVTLYGEDGKITGFANQNDRIANVSSDIYASQVRVLLSDRAGHPGKALGIAWT